MSCSYHIAEGQTDVLVFGGNKQRKTKFERNVMTDLLIFRFGEPVTDTYNNRHGVQVIIHIHSTFRFC